jgi:hypothetical protein
MFWPTAAALFPVIKSNVGANFREVLAALGQELLSIVVGGDAAGGSSLLNRI